MCLSEAHSLALREERESHLAEASGLSTGLGSGGLHTLLPARLQQSPFEGPAGLGLSTPPPASLRYKHRHPLQSGGCSMAPLCKSLKRGKLCEAPASAIAFFWSQHSSLSLLGRWFPLLCFHLDNLGVFIS